MVRGTLAVTLGLFLHEPLACLLQAPLQYYHFISGFPVLLLSKRGAPKFPLP